MKEILEEKKISQSVLGKKMEKSQQTISNWVTKKRTPKLNDIEKLSKILNVPVIKLIETFQQKKIADEVCDTTAISKTDK